MPKANGSLGNCFKLTVDGKFVGFFAYKMVAEIAAKAVLEVWNPNWVKTILIEKWFIEGEF